ncbi:amino acid ABC transporter permease [Actinomyces howellii]|uniref:Glutamate/aspartate transport system permease protein gltK n=1 Tax=Actinomyces howellii TaxID=52771 RepID=A0A3S4QZX1_9ACTO|nr:amino acid ABC transporter permease [Actinomyces howellii]VEG26740.1 Glutamate/aspartate transport system permease protein gltK [Actinomyces howellii]
MTMASTRLVTRRARSTGPTDSALLFDAPGPRARRRILIVSVLVTVLLAAAVAAALAQLAQTGQLDYPKWRYFAGQSVVRYLGRALRDTLTVTAASAVLSFPLGVVLGWARLGAGRVGKVVVGAWIDAMRAIPMLLLIYFFLLVVPRWGLTLSPFWMLSVPIVMCTSATTAEVFRSGVLSLDRGQSEASLALGLSRGQTMRLVLAPQALRIMLPTLITQLVVILKNSSLGYVVAYAELMYAARLLESSAKATVLLDVYLPVYIIVALLYIGLNWSLGALARRIEARTR